MNYAETAAWLTERDNFLLITHRRPDGDTLGSAGGLCQALRDLGKTAYILENPETTERYVDFVKPYYRPQEYAPETVVTLDTAETGLFPYNIGGFSNQIDLAIDHHASHKEYAAYSCVYGSHAACGEVVYRILQNMNLEISRQVAIELYMAIVTDTGCFRYSNTNPTTLRICADLMEKGIPVPEINKRFFRTKSMARILLESHMLANVDLYDGGRIGVACLTLELMDRTNATEDDTDDIASLVGQIEGVRVSITVREVRPDRCKISVRTWPDVNASDVCAVLGGGGHKAAAGCEVDADVETSKKLIVEAVRKVMRENPSTWEPEL